MTTKINGCVSAFPRPVGQATISIGQYDSKVIYNEPQRGMSLRDYFAAKAMQGILACLRQWDVIENAPSGKRLAARAKLAYEIADAMLAEREGSDGQRPE